MALLRQCLFEVRAAAAARALQAQRGAAFDPRQAWQSHALDGGSRSTPPLPSSVTHTSHHKSGS
jgi:hypothetical protein